MDSKTQSCIVCDKLGNNVVCVGIHLDITDITQLRVCQSHLNDKTLFLEVGNPYLPTPKMKNLAIEKTFGYLLELCSMPSVVNTMEPLTYFDVTHKPSSTNEEEVCALHLDAYKDNLKRVFSNVDNALEDIDVIGSHDGAENLEKFSTDRFFEFAENVNKFTKVSGQWMLDDVEHYANYLLGKCERESEFMCRNCKNRNNKQNNITEFFTPIKQLKRQRCSFCLD